MVNVSDEFNKFCDEKIIVDALKQARVYIRSVERWYKNPEITFKELHDLFFEGDEIENIEAALRQFGIVY